MLAHHEGREVAAAPCNRYVEATYKSRPSVVVAKSKSCAVHSGTAVNNKIAALSILPNQ